MPPAELKSNVELSIKLDNGPSFRPGDVVRGRVVRQAHIVSADAAVTISLCGRAKTKMNVGRGQGGQSVYRGRFNFFGPAETRQTLHAGPIHIPRPAENPKPQVWPFELTIPSHPCPDPVMAGAEGDADNSFLPVAQREVIAGHPLPSTFFAVGHDFNKRFEAYVEYYLEAEIRPHAYDRSSHTAGATLPITVCTPPPLAGRMVHDFALKGSSFLRHVASYRLLPGMQDADLSISQRAAKFFGSQKVPHFWFRLQVECPSVIPLSGGEGVADDTYIPLRLRAVPVRESTSEIIRDAPPPPIVLTHLSLEVKATTAVLCPGSFSVHTASDSKKYGFCLRGLFPRNPPVEVPWVGGDGGTSSASGSSSTNSAQGYLNIGEALRLQVDATSSRVFGKPRSRFYGSDRLHPSFTTYNIRHTHSLRWEVGVAVAGESNRFADEMPVTILASAAAGQDELGLLTPQGSRTAYENGLPPPPDSAGDVGGADEELPAYEK